MDTRFAHLLQPIRDLASNWDVNVAEELEDYLEELENIHFELEQEDEAGSLNFAEAALVIQGSASVYGKKVEHLHNLVYAALYAIGNKRSQADRQTAAEACEEDSDDDVEERFLTLDDFPLGGTEIDLQDQGVAAPPSTVRPPTSLYLLGNCEGPMSLSKLQAVADKSGAIVLDPAESAASTETAMYGIDASHASGDAGQVMHATCAADIDDQESTMPELCSASLEQAFLPAAAQHDKENVPTEEDDIDDPYEPLQAHLPGPLTEKAFKLKMPAKKSFKKAKVDKLKPRLFHAADLKNVCYLEFEIYLKRAQEMRAQQRRRGKNGPSVDFEPNKEASDLYLDETQYDNSDDVVENDDDENEGPPSAPLSPEIGAPDDAFDASHIEAAISYQDTAMQDWSRAINPAWHGELDERVKRWQQSIEPHLLAQEKQPAFDIGAYGGCILETLKAEVQPRQLTGFEAVATGRELWEIPRIFASMLQLVNAGSLIIRKQ